MDLRSCSTHKYLIIGFWLLALSVPISTRAAVISMDTSIGFDGFVQLDKWTPVTVVMENRGRSVSGTLEIRVTSGSEYLNDVYHTTYARELELPYGSRKRCAFTILLRSVAHDVMIRFREGENILVSTAVNLKRNVIDKDVALVLDAGVSPDFLSSLPRQVFPVRVRASHLPEAWYGYDGVRMVIFNPAMLKRLDDRQFQAMERWAGRGGYLITSAGMNYGSFREDRMKRLLSVEINGHHRLFHKTALGIFSGQPLTGPDPLVIVNASVKESETLAAAEGIPLIVQKRIAHGIIVFLSFDIQSPVFNRWAGRQDFWEKILGLAPIRKKIRYDLSDQQILKAMLSSIHLQFPRFWPAASFLLIYMAGTGTLLKKAGTRQGKRKKHTTVLLLVIALFSMAGGWYFFRENRMNRLTYNSFYMLNGTGPYLSGFGKYILGAYSTRNAEFRIGFRDTAYPISHLLAEDSGEKIPNPYRLIESQAGQQVKTDSRKWSYNLFRTESQKDLPVSARVVLRDGMLHLSIENNSAHAILNGLLYYKKRFLPVAPLAARNTKTISIDTDHFSAEIETAAKDLEMLADSIGQKRDPSFFHTMTRRLMKDLLFRIHSTYPSTDNRILFIGWIPAGIIEPQFNDPDVYGEGVALIEWEIPIEKKNETSFSDR